MKGKVTVIKMVENTIGVVIIDILQKYSIFLSSFLFVHFSHFHIVSTRNKAFSIKFLENVLYYIWKCLKQTVAAFFKNNELMESYVTKESALIFIVAIITISICLFQNPVSAFLPSQPILEFNLQDKCFRLWYFCHMYADSAKYLLLLSGKLVN